MTGMLDYSLAVTLVGNFLLLAFFVIVLQRSHYFDKRKFWKAWFIFSCIATAIMVAGDFIGVLQGDDHDGVARHLGRHLGHLAIFIGAFGMHWKLWKPSLFKGSIFEPLAFRAEIDYTKKEDNKMVDITSKKESLDRIADALEALVALKTAPNPPVTANSGNQPPPPIDPD